jgi:hypothetical protein
MSRRYGRFCRGVLLLVRAQLSAVALLGQLAPPLAGRESTGPESASGTAKLPDAARLAAETEDAP